MQQFSCERKKAVDPEKLGRFRNRPKDAGMGLFREPGEGEIPPQPAPPRKLVAGRPKDTLNLHDPERSGGKERVEKVMRVVKNRPRETVMLGGGPTDAEKRRDDNLRKKHASFYDGTAKSHPLFCEDPTDHSLHDKPSRQGKRRVKSNPTRGQPMIGGGMDSGEGAEVALREIREKEKATAEARMRKPVPKARQTHIHLGDGGIEGDEGAVADLRARKRETKNRNTGQITRLEYDEGPSRSMRSRQERVRPDKSREKKGLQSSQMAALLVRDEESLQNRSNAAADESLAHGSHKKRSENNSFKGHRWVNMSPVSKRDEADMNGESMKGRFSVPRPKEQWSFAPEKDANASRVGKARSKTGPPSGGVGVGSNLAWSEDNPRKETSVGAPRREMANPITGSNLRSNGAEKVRSRVNKAPRDATGLLQSEDPDHKPRYGVAPGESARASKSSKPYSQRVYEDARAKQQQSHRGGNNADSARWDSSRTTDRTTSRPSSRYSARPKDTFSFA